MLLLRDASVFKITTDTDGELTCCAVIGLKSQSLMSD